MCVCCQPAETYTQLPHTTAAHKEQPQSRPLLEACHMCGALLLPAHAANGFFGCAAADLAV